MLSLQFESSFFYFTISMKAFHLMTNEMALKFQFISDSLYGRKKYYAYRRLIIDRNDSLSLETSTMQGHAVRS